MSLPDSAIQFLQSQAERVRGLPRRRKIVFPEGNDPRVREAAARLQSEGLIDPVLITDPASEPRKDRYADLLHERRRAKGLTRLEAGQLVLQPLYLGCLMVSAGDADGFVGGAANSTADTVRAALQCIGARPHVRTVSTFMLLCVRDASFGHNGILTIADPAMVIDPTPSELADITVATAASTRALFGIEPVVAMLSFSTKGSGRHKKSDAVVEAFRIVQARAPDLHVDAELQADAALVDAVGRSKAPGSTVAGKANTLIFPDINAANIGYKLVERLGGASAIGPFLQGLARPANDLSRGCSATDIYGVALVTALQSEQA
ncbi:MAG: phosphate acyltransferase [Bryobacteraceae bacterium]